MKPGLPASKSNWPERDEATIDTRRLLLVDMHRGFAGRVLNRRRSFSGFPDCRWPIGQADFVPTSLGNIGHESQRLLTFVLVFVV